MTATTIPALTPENQPPTTIPIGIYADTQLEWFAEPRFHLRSIVVVTTDNYDGTGRERYSIVGVRYSPDNCYTYCLKKAVGSPVRGFQTRWLSDDRWAEEEEIILEYEEDNWEKYRDKEEEPF